MKHSFCNTMFLTSCSPIVLSGHERSTRSHKSVQEWEWRLLFGDGSAMITIDKQTSER